MVIWSSIYSVHVRLTVRLAEFLMVNDWLPVCDITVLVGLSSFNFQYRCEQKPRPQHFMSFFSQHDEFAIAIKLAHQSCERIAQFFNVRSFPMTKLVHHVSA